MYIICYYDNIKEIPTWEGVNGEDAMQNRVAELCESGVCPVEEISVFNEDDEIDNKKEETAQINAVSAEEAIIRWKKYIAYLKEWADDHSDPKFEGMSPAYYNEWMGNEYAEINEDFDD